MATFPQTSQTGKSQGYGSLVKSVSILLKRIPVATTSTPVQSGKPRTLDTGFLLPAVGLAALGKTPAPGSTIMLPSSNGDPSINTLAPMV